MPNNTAKALKTLPKLSCAELINRWREVFGRSPPFRANKDLLLRGLAHRIQEKNCNAPQKVYVRRLRKLVEDFASGNRRALTPAKRIKPGTRLLRQWQGKIHTVTATDRGFDYRGRRYLSLSAIAREITGARWSGPLFFGLKSAAKNNNKSND